MFKFNKRSPFLSKDIFPVAPVEVLVADICTQY